MFKSKISMRIITLFVVVSLFIMPLSYSLKSHAVPIEAPVMIGWGIFAITSGIVNPDFDASTVYNVTGVDSGSVYNPYSHEGLDRAQRFWSSAIQGDWVCCTMATIQDVQDNAIFKKISSETMDILKSDKEFYFGNAEQREAYARAKASSDVAHASYELSKVNWNGTDFSPYLNYETDSAATKKFHSFFNDYTSEQGEMVRQCLYDNVDSETLKLFKCSDKDTFIRRLDNDINNGLVSLTNEQFQAINKLLYMKLNGVSIDISRGQLMSYSKLKDVSIPFAERIYITPVSYIKSEKIAPFTYTLEADKVSQVFVTKYFNIQTRECVYTSSGLTSSQWTPKVDTYGLLYQADNYKLFSGSPGAVAQVFFYRKDKNGKVVEIVTSYIGDLTTGINDYLGKTPGMMYIDNYTFMVSTIFPDSADTVPAENLGKTHINEQSKRIDGVGIDGVINIPVPKPAVIPQTGEASVVKPIAQSVPEAESVPYVPTVPDNPDLPDFDVPNDLTGKFPFCIPFDLIRALKVLVVPPEAPYVTQDIGTTVQGYKIGGKLVLDFAMFDKLAYFSRWLATIGFCYFLLLTTRKVIKW